MKTHCVNFVPYSNLRTEENINFVTRTWIWNKIEFKLSTNSVKIKINYSLSIYAFVLLTYIKNLWKKNSFLSKKSEFLKKKLIYGKQVEEYHNERLCRYHR